jgi:hypothetical protein
MFENLALELTKFRVTRVNYAMLGKPDSSWVVVMLEVHETQGCGVRSAAG